jgi:hypothetical protein
VLASRPLFQFSTSTTHIPETTVPVEVLFNARLQSEKAITPAGRHSKKPRFHRGEEDEISDFLPVAGFPTLLQLVSGTIHGST